MTPVPATIAQEVRGEIALLLKSATHFYAHTDFVLARLERQAEKLANANAVESSIARSELAILRGDLDRGLYWANNIRKLSQQPSNLASAHAQDFCVYVNLGFFSQAAESHKRGYGRINNHAPEPARALTCGLVSVASTGIEEAQATGITLKDVDVKATLNAKAVAAALERLGRTEAELSQVLDLAGTIMRKRNLFWLGSAPQVLTDSESSDPAVGFYYLVGVDPKEAYQMENELLDARIEAGLLFDGVHVGFAASTPEEAGAY